MSSTTSEGHGGAPAPSINASRCPLCGAANGCAMVASNGQPVDCWCRSVTIAPEVLAQLPPAQRGKACICQRCATQADRPGSSGSAG